MCARTMQFRLQAFHQHDSYNCTLLRKLMFTRATIAEMLTLQKMVRMGVSQTHLKPPLRVDYMAWIVIHACLSDTLEGWGGA